MNGPEAFRRTSEVAWRALVIAAAVLALGAILWKLRLVVLPVFIALLLCSALAPLVVALERKGWPSLAATATIFFGFLLVIVGALALIIPPTTDQFASTGSTLDQGLDDIEQWLVEGPLDLERSTVRDYTQEPGGTIVDWARSSSSTVTQGVVVVGEVVAGALLALVLLFLFLKDGRMMQLWFSERVPRRHRDLLSELATAAWNALGGFLRGAALLGTVEGIIIGTTMALVGAPLAVAVGVFTFFGAFFPIVGAVVAGALATIITLTTQGVGDALIVLVVVVVVQQLDGDLLAPVIYGRSLQLHPVVVLVALTAGGALGGIIGAFVAVPLAGAIAGVSAVLWSRRGPPTAPEPDADEVAADP